MKKLMLVVCLLVATVAARAQFEKGTWLINPSVSGLNLSYNTGTDSARFGFDVKGGAFLADNAALLVDLGADWAKGPDTYKLGVGGRYYFDQSTCHAIPTMRTRLVSGSAWRPAMHGSFPSL